MSEENNFQIAMKLLMSGRRQEAAAAFLALYERATEKGFKVQVIDALLTALDPVKENERLISTSSEGLELATELGVPELRAHFMSRKADFLTSKASFFQYRQANLKLAPRWIGFSTEADKANYEALTRKIGELEEEVDRLLGEATVTAEECGNKRVLGFILMSRASVESSRYLQRKMNCILEKGRAKLLLLLHRWGYEIPLVFGAKNARVLKASVDSFTADYLSAAKLLEEIDDKAAGYAYYDLAVHLQSAYRFRKARHYLGKAKVVAERYRDTLLIAKVRALTVSLKARNRDVPNYLAGESREEVVVN